MKRLLIIFIFLFSVNVFNISSSAETKTVMAAGTFEVSNTFALEFYDNEPGKYLYTTGVPFLNIADPSQTFVQADGRVPYDGKNDVGLLCRTNLGEIWYLKIQASPAASPLITVANIKHYLGQPWNRSYGPGEWDGAPADGTLTTDPPEWVNISSTPTTIYTAGPNDFDNLPGGTLCSFSFAINPSMLDPGQPHYCTIGYTLTTDM
jgi:hypothetical protein